MKLFHVFIFLFLLVGFPATNSQDACGASLNVHLPFAVNATALRCLPVWRSEGFLLRYQQVSGGVWSFILSAPNNNAYIAIGFSPSGRMVGSDSVVGWVAGDGTGTVRRYYLGGTSRSSVTVAADNSGNFAISQSSVVSNSNHLYMAFQLTGQPASHLIFAVGPAGALPRSPSYRLAEHARYTSTGVNLNSGTSQQQSDSDSETESEGSSGSGNILLKAHGLTATVGWAAVLPLGIMAARYLKTWDPLWFNTHVALQLTGFSLGVAGIVTGFVLQEQTDAEVDTHKAIGIAILVLGCLQATAILIRPAKSSKIRKYWNWYHFNAGRSAVILGIANAFYGIHLGNAGSAWNLGLGATLAAFLCISVAMELRMWFRS